MKLTLSFTPCPNDCFMFDAIVNQRIDLEGLDFSVRLADIEALNQTAFEASTDVTKLSYHAVAYCLDVYELLDAGSVLGPNCGPLVISKRAISTDEVATGKVTIAIPGKYTTANFLLNLAFPNAQKKTALVFSEIQPALLREQFDAGVIIHEGRFSYQPKGLQKIIDLGQWWQAETGLPLPLGGVAVRRSLPSDVKERVNRIVRRSVQYALAHPDVSSDFVRAHASDMNEEIIRQHIDVYVNQYSIELGENGERAVKMLFERGKATGTIPALSTALYFPNFAC
jgi:1,4-dihydroxy-6-naphthoate synthase